MFVDYKLTDKGDERSAKAFFMVTPCISSNKYFIIQLILSII